MRNFFLIVGPSGSGKTFVCLSLEKYGLSQIYSYTTRKPRGPGEKGHVFVDDYNEWIENNPEDTIVGYTVFAGNHYWATSKQVQENDLYVIDPAGVDFFNRRYCGDKIVKTIYIDIPIYKRFQRMLKRGDSIWATLCRIIGDIHRFWGMKKSADFVVRNDNLWVCRDTIYEYFTTNGAMYIG